MTTASAEITAAINYLMEIGCYGYSRFQNGVRIHCVSIARDIRDARTTFAILTGPELVEWLAVMVATTGEEA